MSQQSLRIMDGRLASLHHSTRRRRMARSRRSLPQTGFSTPLKIISQTVVSLRPMGGSLRSLHRITPSRREKARRRRIPPPTGVNPLLSKVPQVGGVKRQTRLNSRTRHTNHRLEREKCQSNVITIHTRSQGLKPLFTRPRIAQQKVGAIIPTHRAREAAKIGPIKKLQKRSKEQSTRREDQKVKDGIMPMIKGLLLQMNHLRSNQSLNSNQKKFQSQQQDHSKSSMGGGASGWGQPDPAAIDPWGAGADTNHDGTSDRHEIKKQNQFKGPAKGSSSTDTPATADNGWGASPTEAAVGWGSGSQTKTNAGTDSPRQHKALNRSRQTSKTNTGGSEGGWGTPLAEATDPWAASSNHQENVPAARKNKHKATKAKPLKQKHDDRGGKSETQYASTSTRNSSSKSKSHWEPKKDYRPINPQLQSQASSGWDAPSTTDTSGWGSQDTHSSQSQSRPATSSSRRRRANTDDDY
mmetsp:Transcript_6411/g.8418  ORF Transcript_6411/g.8418 Transcript_6411/m.8418 type:complete len:468 (+) Transcript_6411:4349-5752(+)